MQLTLVTLPGSVGWDLTLLLHASLLSVQGYSVGRDLTFVFGLWSGLVNQPAGEEPVLPLCISPLSALPGSVGRDLTLLSHASPLSVPKDSVGGNPTFLFGLCSVWFVNQREKRGLWSVIFRLFDLRSWVRVVVDRPLLSPVALDMSLLLTGVVPVPGTCSLSHKSGERGQLYGEVHISFRVLPRFSRQGQGRFFHLVTVGDTSGMDDLCFLT